MDPNCGCIISCKHIRHRPLAADIACPAALLTAHMRDIPHTNFILNNSWQHAGKYVCASLFKGLLPLPQHSTPPQHLARTCWQWLQLQHSPCRQHALAHQLIPDVAHCIIAAALCGMHHVIEGGQEAPMHL